jgi:hypothetical protein
MQRQRRLAACGRAADHHKAGHRAAAASRPGAVRRR